jgi:preprotein translocase subunit SecG
MNKDVLIAIQIIVSILLSLSIMLQQKGTGLSATFGGQGGFTPSKRGADKFLFNATVVLAIIFVANSLSFFFV